MATRARHRGHTYRGLPSPGETDSYLRASDVRAGPHASWRTSAEGPSGTSGGS